MLSERRVLYSRDCPRDPRACDTDGALEDWNECDDLVMGILTRWVSEDNGECLLKGDREVGDAGARPDTL